MHTLDENTWPIVEAQDGTIRNAGDDWGDADCPFCDRPLLKKGEGFSIGARCQHCGATIIDVS